MQIIKTFFYLIFILSLTNCTDGQQKQTSHFAVAFKSGDECHVCGMVIVRLPGPKGQAFDKRAKKTRKFCSTLDLLSWYLQPENKPNVAEIYVHDMAQTDWETPDDTMLISARDAFFVVGSKKKAAMGKTIASFSILEDANKFMQEWGGEVRKFEQLSIKLILNY